MFDNILNWKLLSGSHDFPGPDGGTCINEAAIIAAGFEYKKIGSADDCPPCFSRPISAYAIGLNDRVPNDIRNDLLMPFVTKLAGTADTPEIEKKRVEFIVIAIVQRIISKLCTDVLNREDLASDCRNCFDLKSAERAANAARSATAAAHAAYATAYAAAAYAAAAHAATAYAAAAHAATAAAHAAYAAASVDATASLDYWSISVQILDEAIMMGNHAEINDLVLVNQRMNEVKQKALETV